MPRRRWLLPRRLWLLGSGSVGLGLLAAAGGAAWWWREPPDAVLARLQGGAPLRVGYAVEAPYAYLLPDGDVTGQSPELARLVAAEAGWGRLEWVQTTFERLVAELQAGRFDVIAAGMFITPSRAEQVRLSEPVVRVRTGVLVRAAAAGPASAELWLQRPGVRLAVLRQSVEAQWLRPRLPAGARLVPVPDAGAGAAAVATGLADALVLSLPTLGWLATSQPGAWQVLPVALGASDSPPVGWVGFQFRLDSPGLQQVWKQAQARVMARHEFATLMQRFGFAATDLAGRVRLDQVLAGTAGLAP